MISMTNGFLSIRNLGLAIFLTLTGLFLAVPQTAQSQGIGDQEAAYTQNFFTPGEPTMQIYIWGDVQNAGIWRVNRDVDFFELLSAAQPGSIGQERVRSRQRITIRVYRTRQGERRLAYEERLETMLEEDTPLPDLQEEDVLEVRTQERRGRLEQFRLIVGVIGSTASLATLIIRLADGR